MSVSAMQKNCSQNKSHLLICSLLPRLAKEIASDPTFMLVHGHKFLFFYFVIQLRKRIINATSDHSLNTSQLDANYIFLLVFTIKVLMLYKKSFNLSM